MALNVVPYYAAVLALLFVALSINVIRGRRLHKIALGTGDNRDMERRIRAHGNFSEYVPFTLLVLAILEFRGGSAMLLHILCLCLVAGRVIHAWGVSHPREDFRIRVAGMSLTIIALAGAAIAILLV